MQVSTFLIIAALIHVLLYVTDIILKSCMCLPYLYIADQIGLVIKPFQLSLSTALFNRPLAKWSFKNSFVTRLWMSIGVLASLVCLAPSVGLLVYNVLHWLFMSPASPPSKASSDENDAPYTPPVLQPVIPGINLSAEELPNYIFTLLVSSVLHEAGHAIAAVREGIHVDGVGLIVLFIFPGAFVLLPVDAMTSLRPFSKLKILCAGVWNNMAIAALALLTAHLLPHLSVVLYSSGQGAVITRVFENSPARGSRGLFADEVIENINGCAIKNSQTWHDCLLEALTERQRGYCVPDSVVTEMDETILHSMVGPDGSVTCCRKARQDSSGTSHLCFELLADGNADATPMQPYSCLPARAALSRSPLPCRDTAECPAEHYCLAPSVGPDERLLRITRRSIADLRSSFSSHKTEMPFGQRRLTVFLADRHYSDHFRLQKNSTRTLPSMPGKFSGSNDRSLEINTRKLNALKTKEENMLDLRRRSNEDGKADEDYKMETDDGHTDDAEALPTFNEVLYLGSPVLLYQTISVSDYIPRSAFVSYGWVEELQEVCLCFVKFSGALALLNLVPCKGFDGEYISDTVVDWCFTGSLTRGQSRLLKSILTAMGTALVAANILVGLLSLSFVDSAVKPS